MPCPAPRLTCSPRVQGDRRSLRRQGGDLPRAPGNDHSNTQLFVGDGRRPFKVGHLFTVQGKDYVETDALVPGDIGAVTKVEEIEFDRVLHDSHDEDHIHLRPLEFPRRCTASRSRPEKKGDEQRLFEVLHKLEMEDPCFKLERHATPTRR